jgi:hypothetical protein
MMSERIIHLEKIIRRAPLALRFRDLLLDKPIGEGLEVQAWRVEQDAIPSTALPATAQRSLQSGIYGFNHLDGLLDYEMDRRPLTDYCADEQAPFNFIVTVRDRLGRYQPAVLDYCLPKARVVEVTLFPTVNRLMPDTFGVIRAQLWDREQQRPAMDALLAVTIAGGRYMGRADERGMVAVFVALPPLPKSQAEANGTPKAITWPVQARAFYRPAAAAEVIQIPGEPTPRRLYGSILQQNAPPPALLLQSNAPEVEVSELALTLQFRVDLTVKTLGNDAEGQPLSRLELRPAP